VLKNIELAEQQGNPANVLAVQTLSSEPVVAGNECDHFRLVNGAKAGFRAVYRALNLDVPIIDQVLRPRS
jgi:hypothetical protein